MSNRGLIDKMLFQRILASNDLTYIVTSSTFGINKEIAKSISNIFLVFSKRCFAFSIWVPSLLSNLIIDVVVLLVWKFGWIRDQTLFWIESLNGKKDFGKWKPGFGVLGGEMAPMRVWGTKTNETEDLDRFLTPNHYIRGTQVPRPPRFLAEDSFYDSDLLLVILECKRAEPSWVEPKHVVGVKTDRTFFDLNWTKARPKNGSRLRLFQAWIHFSLNF